MGEEPAVQTFKGGQREEKESRDVPSSENKNFSKEEEKKTYPPLPSGPKTRRKERELGTKRADAPSQEGRGKEEF